MREADKEDEISELLVAHASGDALSADRLKRVAKSTSQLESTSNGNDSNVEFFGIGCDFAAGFEDNGELSWHPDHALKLMVPKKPTNKKPPKDLTFLFQYLTFSLAYTIALDGINQ